MSQTVKVEKIANNTRAFHMDAGTYVLSMDSAYPSWEDSIQLDSKVDWEAAATVVAGHRVVPYGVNNNLPVEVRNMLDDNNLAPGIIDREIGLLYGQGPELYRKVYSADGIKREWVTDPEVWQWLRSWDYKRFIDMAMVEYKHLKGVFVRKYRNRAPRIGGTAKIAQLRVIPGTDARLVWPQSGSKRLEDVRHILTGDFENNCVDGGVRKYPVYNQSRPFANAVSMSYHNSYSFGRTFYSTPGLWGSRRWIMRSSDVPDTLKYLAENAITSAFHVHHPKQYWEEKRDQLQYDHPDWDEIKLDKKIDELKDEIFGKMVKVLAGKKNAGKFIETVSFHDDAGNLCEWKIEAIDQKIKDFIEALLKISEKADSATTSGLGLHPSLSNIIVNGQLSSGSQMLYALKLYLASDTAIPEGVIFEPINQAIQVNFPGKNLQMGFYHPVVKKEEEVAPKDRVHETV